MEGMGGKFRLLSSTGAAAGQEVTVIVNVNLRESYLR